MNNLPVLLYGATGYTAGLILPQLRSRGIDVVLAGRSESKVGALARRHDLAQAVFSLSEANDIDAALRDCSLVLNAAGPFANTSPPLIDACLRQRVDYLDLSGELVALQYARSMGKWAQTVGVMLLPAVGFDVVPSDCLAVHVARKLPNAEQLRLYIAASNLLSRGSAMTLIEHAGEWIHTRREGRLVPMPFRVLPQWMDFGAGQRLVVAVNWGDLITAHHSTKIPNIEVFFEGTTFRSAAVMANQWVGSVLREPHLQRQLTHFADLIPGGPNEDARNASSSVMVAEVIRGDERYSSRLYTPEAYSFTAAVVARVVERVLGGSRAPGFCTPGTLFGPDFVLEVPGVRRVELV